MNQYLNADTLIQLLTFGVFVLLGFDLSKSVPRPTKIYVWALIVAAVFLGGLVGVEIPAVVVCGIEIYLRMIFFGSCFGFVSGFIVRILPALRLRKF